MNIFRMGRPKTTEWIIALLSQSMGLKGLCKGCSKFVYFISERHLHVQ